MKEKKKISSPFFIPRTSLSLSLSPSIIRRRFEKRKTQKKQNIHSSSSFKASNRKIVERTKREVTRFFFFSFFFFVLICIHSLTTNFPVDGRLQFCRRQESVSRYDGRSVEVAVVENDFRGGRARRRVSKRDDVR